MSMCLPLKGKSFKKRSARSKKEKKTLVLLTQCLAEKIFARQRSGTQHWGLSECEPSTLFPLLQGIHTATTFLPPPPHPLTHTLHTHTGVRHAWSHVCTFAHTQQGEQDAERATWWKDTSHTNTSCLCRERPFYSAGQCLCWLFFVCTFLGTKSNRKD